jgi:hypothetical protein
VAAGLDVAFIGVFVPFSKLVDSYGKLTEEHLADVQTFVEEDAEIAALDREPDAAAVTMFSERLQAAAREQQHQQLRQSLKQPALDFEPPKSEPSRERTDEELYGHSDPDKHKQRYAAA